MLHSGYLVAGCVVVFSKLRFNDNLRVELIRHDEIRRLIKPDNALGSLGFTEADARSDITASIAASTTSRTNSETLSRWPVNGLPESARREPSHTAQRDLPLARCL